MTHNRTLPIAAPVTALLLLLSLASNLHAQPHNGTQAATNREVRNLKVAYLRCDRAATERLLDVGEAANCSAIHEKLLKVGFDGDFKRLLAWWHAERIASRRDERIATP
ncbi:hypothetical protein [Hydrogenophaga sp.]|uniref:hypothetical protein n=1 Tax=Hydrogenophaga sp. TaxID=1904254 RepID=UPI00286D8AB4|nr:hypothetical protein [Hydrogenophaga sp.]